MNIRSIWIIAMFVVAACATIPLEQELNHRGNVALDAKSYDLAIENYREGFAAAERADNQQYAAIAAYGLGRAYGYSCNFSEAEKWFKRSIALRSSIPNSDVAYLSQNHLELARLYVSREKWTKAVSDFQQAIPLLERTNAEARDPIGYANVLETYRISLDKLGYAKNAAKVELRIQKLREDYSGRSAYFVARPYPDDCS